MAVGWKFTYAPYHTLTVVGDTTKSMSFDLFNNMMLVCIYADVVAPSGRRIFVM